MPMKEGGREIPFGSRPAFLFRVFALAVQLRDPFVHLVRDMGIRIGRNRQELIPRDVGIGAGVVVPIGIPFFLVAQIRHLHRRVAVQDGPIG